MTLELKNREKRDFKIIPKWAVFTERRKQLKLIKIPKNIIEKENIIDGETLRIKIVADKADVFIIPMLVTSGGELFVTRSIRESLSSYKHLVFEILPK